MAGGRIQRLIVNGMARLLSGGEGDEGEGDDHSSFGVHITYDDLYRSFVFLTAIYLAGQVASRLLKMPGLVGEIIAGILLGPPLANFVPNAEAWVMLGELGLILLVVEAGIDIDLATLSLIGTRGFLIAFVGSVLPIALGLIIALAIGTDMKSAIAAGATFGPTSLGIALNILRSGNILNTPVGQLIVSAAVIDDMIALVILSQLDALTGEVSVLAIIIPVISALAFLVGGGYVAIFILPKLINKYILTRVPEEYHGKTELTIMFALILVMMPATYYAKASYLMGAFVSGLTFCTSHNVHVVFVSQFKRILQWLMRIFFAASIGFQVPIKDFGSGTVIWQGLLFTLALTGKLAVGFMVPNFNQTKRFTDVHLRDCLVTGYSMAAEGEFAFVIAVFAVDNGLISKDLYASVVLAVLISTIIPPFLLRYTIARYNKKAELLIQQAAQDEMERNHNLNTEDKLLSTIKNHTAVFLCIQTQSDSKWGILHSIMSCMNKQGLEIIDHRSWHPRGVNTTLVNEIYAKDVLKPVDGQSAAEALDERLAAIQEALVETLGRVETSKVKVQRWYPGVVQEIQEDTVEKTSKKKGTTLSVQDRVISEAGQELERKHKIQTGFTQEKSVEDILGELPTDRKTGDTTIPGAAAPATGAPLRRRRMKTRSTPVVGGGLFGEATGEVSPSVEDMKQQVAAIQQDGDKSRAFFIPSAGVAAEVVIKGEAYQIRLSSETYKRLRTGYSGEMLNSHGISFPGQVVADAPVVDQLRGFVRTRPQTLTRIGEHEGDGASEVSDSEKAESGATTTFTQNDPSLPPV